MQIRKGREYAEDFMSSKCCIVGMDAEELGKTGLNLFLQFLGKFRGCPGQVCLDLIYIVYHSFTHLVGFVELSRYQQNLLLWKFMSLYEILHSVHQA